MITRLLARSSRLSSYRAEYVGRGKDGMVRVRVAFRAPADFRVDLVKSRRTYLVNARHFQWADLSKATVVRYPLDRFSRLAGELQAAFQQMGLGSGGGGAGGSTARLHLHPRLRLQATREGVDTQFSLHFQPTPPHWVGLVRKAPRAKVAPTAKKIRIQLGRRQLTFDRHTGLPVADVLRDEDGQILSEWRLLRLDLRPTLADSDFDGSDLQGMTVKSRPLPAQTRKRMTREVFDHLLRWSTRVLANRWNTLTQGRKNTIRVAMAGYYDRWIQKRTAGIFLKSALPLLSTASGCTSLRTAYTKGGFPALIAKAKNPQKKTEELALGFATGLCKKLYSIAAKVLAGELAKGLAQVKKILASLPGVTPSTRTAVTQLHRAAIIGGFSPRHYRTQARKLVPTILKCWSGSKP